MSPEGFPGEDLGRLRAELDKHAPEGEEGEGIEFDEAELEEALGALDESRGDVPESPDLSENH